MFKKLTQIPVQGAKIIQGCYVIQAATITSISSRGWPLTFKKPFPVGERKFRWYDNFIDPTIVRLKGENSKIIAVEGPIGVGKSAFCQVLADEFQMKFIPQPTMDEIYILPGGHNLRDYDDQVPELVRTYDHKNFCVDPFNFRAIIYQFNMLHLRFYQYVDALCHLFNSGQGVILERSYFSDYVFLKAMTDNGYVSPEYLKIYFIIKKQISTFFGDPHLVIYLDIPVPVVQERIKTRNYSYEQNSPALTNKYLESLEKYWKQDYLLEASKNSEVLIYDWSDGGNVEVVIDDIENINFDLMREDKKFTKWWLARKDLFNYRVSVTNYSNYFDNYFYYPWYQVEDILNYIKASAKWYDIITKFPESKFSEGYNYYVGDSILKILFSYKTQNIRKRNYLL